MPVSLQFQLYEWKVEEDGSPKQMFENLSEK
jgi:hypothetical protein